ncbi:hypothetical protein SAMN04489742_1306 [Arthrobacter crystallopoietes]|uniref:DUF6457 domain-containing protein n=2 Tax=Crystallibacter crystallopoietes TaxID=37928 RepID=A0A1H1B9W5_9MICC|nr:hypothetical protein SAMN04489742_1306 [Arthrobacter crystallopoietes]
MAGAEEMLEPFVTELLAALEIEDTPVDLEAVLGLAGVAAHSVIRPAAPVTTFIVGYAAGLGAATGQAAPAVAMRAASRVADEVARRHATEGATGGTGATGATGAPGNGSAGNGTGETGQA